MSSPFTQILRGELPAHFIWTDAVAVAFLDTRPHTPGHTLVIPRREIDLWTDLTDAESERLFWVAKQIGAAQRDVFECVRSGLIIAGYHVPHVHLHVFPTNSMADFDFRELPAPATPAALDTAGSMLRAGLRNRGFDPHTGSRTAPT
jgi:histidine triad (HIT) family protein